MTRHESFTTPLIAKKEFVLATDLDGTFLGGTAQERQAFYQWVETHRDRIGLIFVTGRDSDFITDLTRQRGVPKPDYVIGDVGTTIAEVDTEHTLTPIDTLEEEIASAWNGANKTVQAALKEVPGLRLQPTQFRYRVSYDIDPALFDAAAAFEIVENLGLDALTSDNRYFDVLPGGVSKGPSLLRLLAHLGIDKHRTLVAGDTLNDLSMLTLGVPAVAVGGSEQALIDRVSELAHVHCAQAIGVSGIMEAIETKRLFPAS